MKIRRFNALQVCRVSLLAVAAATLFFTTACNPETLETSELIRAEAMGAGCNPSEFVDFPLDTTSTDSGDIEFKTKVNTGEYYLTGCLCRIANFDLIFDNVEPNVIITVLDAHGNPVVAQIAYANGLAYLTIPNPEDLPDEDLSLSIDFEYEGNNQPSITYAGGLCIIENVVGSGDVRPKLKPHKLIHQFDSTTKVYIPAGIGGPPY